MWQSKKDTINQKRDNIVNLRQGRCLIGSVHSIPSNFVTGEKQPAVRMKLSLLADIGGEGK
jgi:hypothetical protein